MNASPLPLFADTDLPTVQATGSAWVIDPERPATVPVPLQTVIVGVKGPYTERDRKLWVFLIHAVFDQLGTTPVHSLPVRDINAVFREAGGEHDTKWIWESARRLAATQVEWTSTLGDERFEQGVSSMFGAVLSKSARQTGTLTFEIPALLVSIIKEPMRFARLRVHFLLKLSGKYAVTLYEILEGFANRRDGRCEVSLDELRTWLKVREGSYTNWKDFRKRVLDPAVKQINDDPVGAGFSVAYSPIRDGKSYSGVVFQLTKTDNRQTTERLLKRSAKAKRQAAAGKLVISEKTEQTARAMAGKSGFDYQAIWHEWLNFANNPKNPDAAFIGFLKKKIAQR